MSILQVFFEDFETNSKKAFNNYGEAAYNLDKFLTKYNYSLDPQYDDVTDFLKPIKDKVGNYELQIPVYKDNVKHMLNINLSKEESMDTDFIPMYTIDYKVV